MSRSTDGQRRVSGGRGAVVPEAEVRTYYDRPVIAPPVWKPEIPWYFFSGGMAGASATLAAAARITGHDTAARAARRVGALAFAASPPLLIADLGRPERFANMLRVFRPSSPMNMGSWLLAGFGPAVMTAAALAEAGRLPRLQRMAEVAAGTLGTAMATYTAVLVANTAVPVWHEARHELPFVFAGSAAASAGAAALLLDPSPGLAPARRLALSGAALEQAATKRMEDQLGDLAGPYRHGTAGRFARAARALTIAGAAAVAAGERRPGLCRAGAGLLLGGAVCERFAVFRAGFASAEDPRYTVGPQRARLDGGQPPARSSSGDREDPVGEPRRRR